jgi:RNA polymerase sigma factor (sigma-70 family)
VEPHPTDAAAILESRLDPSCFGEVFDRHFRAIYWYVARRVGRELAEELAAEVFVVAFEQRAQYDADRPDARPWLFGIAANLLRRHRRRERRRLLVYARAGAPSVAQDEIEDAENRADAARTGKQVALALAALRPEEREVLLLFAWAELSYEEIAQALQVPVGTVRSRLSRARTRIRRVLSTEARQSRTRWSTQEAKADG